MPASIASACVPVSEAHRRPLSSRPIDCFYILYFTFHIVNFLCIDGQSFWPFWMVPSVLQGVKKDYLRDSGDPFIQAFDNGDSRYLWFNVSVYESLILQNPVFVAGVWLLWKGELRIVRRCTSQPSPARTIEEGGGGLFLTFDIVSPLADDKRIYPILSAYGILGEYGPTVVQGHCSSPSSSSSYSSSSSSCV
jgi:hypothetical protein